MPRSPRWSRKAARAYGASRPRSWWWHYVEGETLTDDDDSQIYVPMAYAWQRAIDLGHAQPVTAHLLLPLDFPVPSQEWIGLGLTYENSEAWDEVWGFGDDYDAQRRLERRWVEREVRQTIMPENLDELVNGLFDEDGDWLSEDQRVNLSWDQRVMSGAGWNGSINIMKVSKPEFFSDLILKVDRQGAPDYASGWWNDAEGEDEDDRH